MLPLLTKLFYRGFVTPQLPFAWANSTCRSLCNRSSTFTLRSPCHH